MGRCRALPLLVMLLGTALLLGAPGPARAGEPHVWTVEQLAAALGGAASSAERDFHLVDVRTAREHAAGTIPATDRNIDHRQIASRHGEIGAAPDEPIVVYCQSGRRSARAARILADLGYRRVYDFSGSVKAWLAAGRRLVPPGD